MLLCFLRPLRSPAFWPRWPLPATQTLLAARVAAGRGSPAGRSFLTRSPSQAQLAALAAAAARAPKGSPARSRWSVHGAGEYWRVMRAASELAAMGESGGDSVLVNQ